MGKDWRDMTPEEFGLEPPEADGLFPLPVELTKAPEDGCGTGDLLAELDGNNLLT